MAEHPYMPLWTDAYLGDTTHLTTLEHGAYLLLLIAMWRAKDKSLPADDRLLARYCGLTGGQWKRVKPIIAEFFTIKNGRWTQGRLTDEAEAVRRNSKKQSDKAKARWLKNKETADAVAMPGRCPDDASHNHTHTHTHKYGGGGTRAGATPDAVLSVIGVDLAKTRTPTAWMDGAIENRLEVWRGLGLDDSEILSVLSQVAASKPGGPPSSLAYFDGAMERAAGAKVAPTLRPIEGGRAETDDERRHRMAREVLAKRRESA